MAKIFIAFFWLKIQLQFMCYALFSNAYKKFKFAGPCKHGVIVKIMQFIVQSSFEFSCSYFEWIIERLCLSLFHFFFDKVCLIFHQVQHEQISSSFFDDLSMKNFLGAAVTVFLCLLLDVS